MKISFVAPDDLTRQGRVRRHARALADAGHRVTVHGVLAEGAEPEEDDGPVVLVRVPLPRFRAPRGGVLASLGAKRAWRRFEPLVDAALKRDPPDAVQVFGIEAAAAASEPCGKRGLPLVYDEASPFVFGDGPMLVPADAAVLPEKGRRGTALDRTARALLDRGAVELRDVLSARLEGCVAASDTLADAFAHVRGDRPVVVRDLPPKPTRRRAAGADPPRPGLRARLAAAPGTRVAVFHGPLDDARGIETAIRSLVHSEEALLLAVIGAAWCADRVLSIAEASGVAARVRPMHRPPEEADLALWLAEADVALFPLDPAAPAAAALLPAEASACIHAGVPLVVTAGTETARVVRAHGLGAVSEGTTPATFAGTLRGFLRDAPAHAAAAKSCGRAARGDLCWETERLRLVDLWDRIGSS
ncbi:MAG: hypothetical protein HMLKMBBP_02313 [Planctomycetes bacterium]|nr:hypothetical protein [Planctomycetota bacterium]